MKNFSIASIIATILAICLYLLGLNWEVVALMFTAVYIAWYSLETHKLVIETKTANKLSGKMWQEMVMTNKLSIQPAVIMEYNNDWRLTLRNIGKGVAMNIDIKIMESKIPYIFKFHKNILGPGESVFVQMQREDGFVNDFHKEFRTNSVRAIIFFERIKRLPKKLTTEIEFKNPPIIDILETNWQLD